MPAAAASTSSWSGPLISHLKRGNGTIGVPDEFHGYRAAKWILLQRRFAEFETQPWFCGQRHSTVHHAHGGKSEPLCPDLFFLSYVDKAADFLNQKVRHGGVDVKRGEDSDGS